MSDIGFFTEMADELLATRPRASRNAKGSLVVTANDGRSTVRAMTSGGRVVVKLDRDHVLELVAAGVGNHYKGQVNEWLELSSEVSVDDVRRLTVEALER